MLPSLLDSKGLEQFEVVSLVNPHLVIAHTTYHGCILLLYTVIASVEKDNTVARAQSFEAARSLAELFGQIRGAKGVTRARNFVLPMVRVPVTAVICLYPEGMSDRRNINHIIVPSYQLHAMNAARFFAAHVKSPEVQKDKRTLTICYQSLCVLSDYLLELHSFYPRWSEYFPVVRDCEIIIGLIILSRRCIFTQHKSFIS